jgi:hypothetical protein
MRTLYRVIVASKTFAAAVSGQLSEKTLTSASTVREIPSAQRRTNLRTWMRLHRAFAVLFGATAISIVSGCTALQTQENTLEQIATIEDVRYSQLLTNVSAAISQRDSVPSQGVPSSGTATTSATGVLAFTLTQPFAFAKNTKTFTPTAMLNWQNNWGITPISDPQDLQNLRALYGLIYRTDAQVAEFIGDSMKIQGSSTNKPIDMNYLVNFWAPQCGISLNPPSIQNPNVAMESYFNALKAFPQYSFSYRLLPDQKQNSKGAKQNQQKILTTVCFGDVSSLGLANDSIAYQYGLLYPTIAEVFASLRNGIGPACRHYQLENMFAFRENGIVKGNILFTRWLFWKAPDGSWAPNEPPFEPEYLGKYGARDFWTTSPACINDFIILTINATANSHAVAQNAPKVTPTPALQQ